MMPLMTKVHEFLDKYLGQSDCMMELENGKWVKAQPIQDPPGLWRRIKDAWEVVRGRAEAVEKK